MKKIIAHYGKTYHKSPATQLELLTRDPVTAFSGNDRPEERSQVEASPYLQIQSVPITERIDPEKTSYILVILPQQVRAAGGQFTAEEAHAIAKITRGWDWSLDEKERLRCLPALEALLGNICKRSFEKGGAK
jgi:hypothetical protein